MEIAASRRIKGGYAIRLLLIRAAERHIWRKSRRMRKPGTIFAQQANDKAASETLEQMPRISRRGVWAGLLGAGARDCDFLEGLWRKLTIGIGHIVLDA